MCSFLDLLERGCLINCTSKTATNQWKQLIASIADNISDQTLLRLLVIAFGDAVQESPCDLLFRLRQRKEWGKIDSFVRKPPKRHYERFIKTYVLKPNKRLSIKEVPDILPFKVIRHDRFIEVELITDDLVDMLDKARPNSLTPIHETLKDTWFHIGIHNISIIVNGENQNVK